MKVKLFTVTAALILGLASICQAYSTYSLVNVVPQVIEGDVDVTLVGRNIRAESGGIRAASDVDTHQVSIHEIKTFGGNVRIGDNKVEYVPTDELILGWNNLFETFYQVDVNLLPNAAGSEAFVLVSADNGLWYKIYIIQNLGVKILYSKNGSSSISKVYRYNAQPTHGYRVQVNDMHNSLEIVVRELGESKNIIIARATNLATSQGNKLFRFFVGTSGGSATFRNEVITVYTY
jgi:hypothetical protein